jgi:uncharacterized surface protein with fasciclin (FAS1) repeats
MEGCQCQPGRVARDARKRAGTINITSGPGREGFDMKFGIKNALRFAAVATITATMGIGMTGCGMGDNGPAMSGEQLSKPSENIIQIATGDNMGDVSKLVKAVQAAGLVDTLEGPGPFTVFAPTNEAFDALPPGMLDDLLKPENKEKLKSILLYHVHAGDAIMASQVHTMNLSTADAGKSIAVSVDNGTVTLTGGQGTSAKVIKTDIKASNGVIHWIDHVLLPPM